VIVLGGRSYRRNRVAKNFQRGDCNMHFSRLMARQSVARALKRLPNGEGVFACPESPQQ
jgi:hypothetical protein